MAEGYPYQGKSRPRIPVKLVIALVIAGFALFKYWGSMQSNAVTGKSQAIALSVPQEIALGLQSAPKMAAQFGGLSSDRSATERVRNVGAKIVAALPKEAREASGKPAYPFEYFLLADKQTVNAFALPGGPIFITEALYARLQTEGQLAGVLGHETGHVLGRHSAAQMAKGELMSGLVGAATVAGSDASDGGRTAQAVSSMVANMLTLKYGRGDEYEADHLGLRFMANAGYDPRAMIGVMEILDKASGGGSSGKPEFSSTHPNPGNRIEQIKKWIAQEWPNGVPAGLTP